MGFIGEFIQNLPQNSEAIHGLPTDVQSLMSTDGGDVVQIVQRLTDL
jgi:hypothetical protein